MRRKKERYKSCAHYRAGNCFLTVCCAGICMELQGKLDVEVFRTAVAYSFCRHYRHQPKESKPT